MKLNISFAASAFDYGKNKGRIDRRILKEIPVIFSFCKVVLRILNFEFLLHNSNSLIKKEKKSKNILTIRIELTIWVDIQI